MKTAAVAVCLALICSCATTRSGEKTQEAIAHYKIGVSYLNENKVQQAFVEMHKALELDPHNKEVLTAIGIIYLLHFEEPQKSVEYFEKAAKEDRDYSEAYNNLGYAYEKMGRYDEAIAFYHKALSNPLYPTAEKAYINLGNAYYRLRKYDSAIASFREAIKRAPDLGIPYLRLALCFNSLGKYGDAAAAMNQAIKLEPAYKGSRERAVDDFTVRKLRAGGFEEQDLRDYLEILKY